MTDQDNVENVSGIANRERMLFVRVQDTTNWDEEQMDNVVTSIDSVTPEDVGVMLTSADIEYMDEEEVEDLLEAAVKALDG